MGNDVVEQPLSTGAENRSFSLLETNGALVLPTVRFDDAEHVDCDGGCWHTRVSLR